MNLHVKCRNLTYPFTEISRLKVIDCMVPWTQEWIEYNPPSYTSPKIVNKPWSDPELIDSKFKPNWNDLDGPVNRTSHSGVYKIVENCPLNIIGRTGLKGRGVLGRWGPNHAADPIVTRWKRKHNEIVLSSVTKKPILQFCAIRRRDNHEWAIPGGMVDPNEEVTETLKREFQEEALNNFENENKGDLLIQVQMELKKFMLEASAEGKYPWGLPSGMVEYKLIPDKLSKVFDDEAMDFLGNSGTNRDKNEIRKMVEGFFDRGNLVYKGYVDDPRNTDNAWMETVAYNFHDDFGDSVGKFPFYAGDDATKVRWMDLDNSLKLYASHAEFLKIVCHRLQAHW